MFPLFFGKKRKSSLEEKIQDLLEEKLQEEEFADCYIVDIEHHGNRLEVYLDSDSGITFQTCRRISRYLESYLDEEGWLGEKYTLEVSSPGLSRPLKLRRQYIKNIGRKVEVKTHEGEKYEGTLQTVTEDKITLFYKERVKVGKRKQVQEVERELPFEEIKTTIVKATF